MDIDALLATLATFAHLLDNATNNDLTYRVLHCTEDQAEALAAELAQWKGMFRL